MTRSDSIEHQEVVKKALSYAAGLCVRAEQCEQDIRQKLRQRGVESVDVDKIIIYLTEHKFLSDERFAKAYVRTKSRLSGWGPWKIRRGLVSKGIDAEIIRASMQEADASEYEEKALSAAMKKARKLDLGTLNDRQKIYRFLASRGYESATIGRVMAKLGSNAARECDESDELWQQAQE